MTYKNEKGKNEAKSTQIDMKSWKPGPFFHTSIAALADPDTSKLTPQAKALIDKSFAIATLFKHVERMEALKEWAHALEDSGWRGDERGLAFELKRPKVTESQVLDAIKTADKNDMVVSRLLGEIASTSEYESVREAAKEVLVAAAKKALVETK